MLEGGESRSRAPRSDRPTEDHQRQWQRKGGMGRKQNEMEGKKRKRKGVSKGVTDAHHEINQRKDVVGVIHDNNNKAATAESGVAGEEKERRQAFAGD